MITIVPRFISIYIINKLYNVLKIKINFFLVYTQVYFVVLGIFRYTFRFCNVDTARNSLSSQMQNVRHLYSGHPENDCFGFVDLYMNWNRWLDLFLRWIGVDSLLKAANMVNFHLLDGSCSLNNC